MVLVLRRKLSEIRPVLKSVTRYRCLHHLSKMFIPSGTVTLSTTDKGGSEGHFLLLKTGMIRQSSAGVFAVLPLGQLVMDKIEKQIDQSMHNIGASKLSLPTLGPQSLWTLTGRWQSSGQELFKLKDRKSAEFCLSPTHEESITKIVAAEVNGYKQFPIRVYQIGRKYRDEMRPRGGMLRGKEFLMKDLYTFDDGVGEARKTYHAVREAYDEFFQNLNVRYLVAEADSGNIGGELSHEYHLPSAVGEDTLLKCPECQYTANRELAKTDFAKVCADRPMSTSRFSHQVFRDTVFFDIRIPTGRAINMLQALREAQKLDSSVKALAPLPEDYSTLQNPNAVVHEIPPESALEVASGDPCPKCENGHLTEVQAIEIGHTFYLGTKYSKALNFKYFSADGEYLFPEMGCYGIGVSRLLTALAEIKYDQHGLNWPNNLAPFNTVLIADFGLHDIARKIAQDPKYQIDAIDDRVKKSINYKVKELQQMGVPEIIVLSKRFLKVNTKVTSADDITNTDGLLIEHVEKRGDPEKTWVTKRLSEWRR